MHTAAPCIPVVIAKALKHPLSASQSSSTSAADNRQGLGCPKNAVTSHPSCLLSRQTRPAGLLEFRLIASNRHGTVTNRFWLGLVNLYTELRTAGFHDKTALVEVP